MLSILRKIELYFVVGFNAEPTTGAGLLLGLNPVLFWLLAIKGLKFNSGGLGTGVGLAAPISLSFAIPSIILVTIFPNIITPNQVLVF
tara:strand:+ start:313 stop:576 length:264 start_codon:yes stop_codon:yes gene_type:complete